MNELTISHVGRRGDGVADGDGRAVYIPRTLPGETIRVDVDGAGPHLLDIVAPSPERALPFCKYFDACGGCQLQHWQEMPYRAWKRELVVNALAGRGIAAKVNDLIDAHGAGRGRVSLHVRKNVGQVTAGFMAARSHDLVDIDHCPVLVPALNDATAIARAFGARLGDCDVALTASETGIDASVKAERKIVTRELEKLAPMAAALGLARLTVNGETIAALAMPAVRMGRALVTLPPVSFLQATQQGERELAGLVLSAAAKAKSVADLFCGLGPFALRLAETARVTGFDSDPLAVAALNQAARMTRGLKPVTAAARDLFRAPLVAGELKEFDAVVLDPPRAGAEAQSRQLAKSKVKTIVMVSCDPLTLARDVEILVGGGYRLGAVTPVDQFKWTSHVETVAVFHHGVR